MRIAGSVYIGEGLEAIAVYSKYSDIYTALPPSISGEHVMHAKYGFQNQVQSIDVYLAKNISKEHLAINRIVNNNANGKDVDVEQVLRNHNITFETTYNLKNLNNNTNNQGNNKTVNIESEIQRAIATDVAIYCKHVANNISNARHRTEYVQKIIPQTEIAYVNTKSLLTSGKSEFVDACILEANLDFVSNDGECVSGFVPMNNIQDSFFDIKNNRFVGFYSNKFTDCAYCYASHQHKRPYPKAFIEVDSKRLKEELMYGTFEDFSGNKFGKHVKILRLGKRTETGAIYNRPQLITTLETCIDTKTSIVMPTKFLEFDKNLIDLFKKTNTKLLYSISNLDDLEYGPIMHGCSNDWRFEQARKYKEAGVDASIYLTMEISYNPKPEHLKTINDAIANGLKVQLLGARIGNKNISERITGRTWNQLKGEFRSSNENNNLFSNLEFDKTSNFQTGGYALTGNTTLTPEHVNSELLKIIGDNKSNIRMCHHNNEKTWCGSCFLYNGCITKTKEITLSRIKKKPKIDKELTGKLF